MMPNLPTSRQWRALASRLSQAYGIVPPPESGDPLDAVIGTILSQSTNGTLSRRAFGRLKERFPTWDAARRADLRTLQATIRVGGLSRSKARWIHRLLRRLHRETGQTSLDYLSELTTEAAMRELVSFDGVGPKTAACVLLFALTRPVFPVDTHIHRIARRQGWVGRTAGAEQTFHILDAAIPDQLKHELHVHLISHGRAVCRARKPLCDDCVIERGCSRAGVSEGSKP